ncbi:MAG: monovalent cation/H+ antiporter complex subunit F [Lachnospiraceae bacterium]|nr:monovalent cation/H+ antiporter complex subunit F [Lachnospiraceae bacterium]MDY5699914.1 monovalent cation/H+ antiporter complex subunit F [Lachnospiraceae bacterium]
MIAAQNLSVLETVYKNLYIFTLIFLAIMLILCLIRSIKGPKIADRIVAVNMMGTMVMVIIVVLSLLLKESYLVDICIIYAMISFLAVVVLTKVYMGIYRERKIQEEKEKGEKE